MNKRSAMFVAAGLVLSLLVAGLAMAMGVTGPSADAKTTARDRKPVVETVTRTVTIHKKAKADDSAETVIVRTAAPSSTDSDDGGFDDDAYEDHESDDHEDGEDHESDDHEDGEDHGFEHEDEDDD